LYKTLQKYFFIIYKKSLIWAEMQTENQQKSTLLPLFYPI